MFGTKIVNDPKTAETIDAVIEHVERGGIGLELGYYFDNGMFDPLKLDAPGRVNIHFHYDQVTIADLPAIEPLIHRDVMRARGLGGSYGIIHLNDYTVPEAPDRDFSGYLGRLERAEAIAERYDFPFYIENVQQSLAYFEGLFGAIFERRLTHLHCCFDLGHAKALSASRHEHTASDWIACLHRLRGKGFKIHFHLHNNSGADDEHLSFAEAERQGLNAPDRFSDHLSYLELLAKICREFPEERKIFEVKMELALENLVFVLDRLGALDG